MTPFFSVIVPTYNRGHIISNTIESVLRQDFTDYELLIIDDGSTDNTSEVVQKYLSDKVFYYKKNNAERAEARNYGTNRSRGAYINWLDSDDVMHPGHLSEMKRAIDANNNPALLAAGYEVEKKGEGIIYKVNFPSQVLNAHLLRSNFMRTSTGIARRDVALQNPFNTEAIPQEDHELFLRIGASHDIVSNNTITIRMVEHPQSGSVQIVKDAPAYVETLDRMIKTVSSSRRVCLLFNKRMCQFKMYKYIGGAYFLATHGMKRLPLQLIMRSINCHPLIFFRKEFYATVKHLLLTYR